MSNNNEKYKCKFCFLRYLKKIKKKIPLLLLFSNKQTNMLYRKQTHKTTIAGGISGCGDWQVKIKELIHSKANDLILINPRRANFDVTNPSMTEEQIIWEHNHLSKSTAVLFYFPSETLCPITLYEL